MAPTAAHTMHACPTSVLAKLHAIGQDHVLRFFDRLDPAEQAGLLAQIELVDWAELVRLIDLHVRRRQPPQPHGDWEPAPCYPCRPTARLRAKYRKARALGEQLVAAGKVGALTVAGGQGTRLGWPGPKGTFPATAVRGASLFQWFAECLAKTGQKYGASVPWYIMTSPANDEETRRFFRDQGFFGLAEEDVFFFRQGVMPAVDRDTGRVLLEGPASLALSPDGHGGSLKALYASGALADMRARGIEQISYTQVDNPLVRMVDPLFLGLHALDGAEMSSKMVPKAFPGERIGVFCRIDGRIAVIEYSNLPEKLAEERGKDGELRFSAGSIAIHVIRLDFVERLNHGRSADGRAQDAFALPFHRADKAVPHLDLETGERVVPRQPNGVKLESFVFDALALCERSIIYETDRAEEFAPIKNADGPGAVDSPATSMRLQTERAARWLAARGVAVARRSDGCVDAVLEIQPRTAIEPADLDGAALPERIPAGSRLLL